MKIKTKTFILTFILFLSVFFSSLILISVLFLNNQIESALERGINEHYLISNSMGKELNNLIERGAKKEDAVEYLYKYYSEHYAHQKGYIQIFKNDKLLYNSFNSVASVNLSSDYIDYKEKSRKAVFKNFNNKDYIIVSGEFPQTNQEYKIQYIYDITSMIEMWENMRNALFFTGIGFSIVAAVLLVFLLNIAFKPLNEVIVVSKEIADGNYEKRIHISKTHELVSLADSFNYMAEKVQEAIIELSNDAKQKQQFIDNFSHEIRTPLTSVYGFAEYMQKSALSEKERINISGYIMEDSRHILSIADRLLDLATLKNRSITKKNYSINSLYNTTANLLRKRLNEKQAHLIQEKSIESIYGDEDLLQSLLVNITNNAIDASKSDGIIKWNTYSENGNIVLSVSDEGKGISKDQIDKINEPFYRVDKIRNRESGNAGLGLAICEQIAECHNAKIKFESELNLGTTVKIIFTSS